MHPLIGAAPSMNSTVPVGTPLAGDTGAMVAVNVTAYPSTIVPFDGDVIVVVVEPCATVCVSVGEVEPSKSASPLYTALIAYVPASGNVRLHEATPPAIGCAAHPLTTVAPSRNVTVPVGVPLAGATAVTVAVYVRPSPGTDGFTDDAITAAVAP